MIKKPMLASKITDLKKLKYPLYASPKYDGIRAITSGGKLLSRQFKPIPNKFIQDLAEGLPDGLDGELILRTDTGMAKFNETSSVVMDRDKSGIDVNYYVFDYVMDSISEPADSRYDTLCDWWDNGYDDRCLNFVLLVGQTIIHNEQELLEYEKECLTNGFEGVMVKAIKGPYKEGRSTEREGYLLKLKRFEDSEAKVIGFEEKQHNENTLEQDAFGNAKRSSAKAGLKGADTLGKVYVIDCKSNVEFEIGTGFDEAQRKEIWNNQDRYLGKIVKYKYQPHGVVDKPRFPVFLGWRDERDM